MFWEEHYGKHQTWLNLHTGKACKGKQGKKNDRGERLVVVCTCVEMQNLT